MQLKKSASKECNGSVNTSKTNKIFLFNLEQWSDVEMKCVLEGTEC